MKTTAIGLARPWRRSAPSLPAIGHAAAARRTRGWGLAARAVALLGRRAAGPPVAPAFDLPAARGASDAELIRLSRRPAGLDLEAMRLLTARAVILGAVGPSR